MFTFLDRFLPTQHEKRMTTLVISVILLVGISLTSRLVSVEQNLQQRANEPESPLNGVISNTPSITPLVTESIPQVTIDPLSTSLNITVTLDSVKSPVLTTRIFTVKSFDSENKFISSESTPITFQNGSFKGIINMTNLQTGTYTFTISTQGYLTQELSKNPKNITKGSQITFPNITLSAGDINGDSILNTLDYTILANCLDETQKTSCTTSEKESSDLNDDNLVDQLDYKILLNSLK